MARMSKQEREEFVTAAHEAFTQRLERIANDPEEWITWIERTAAFGAHYSVGNQWLLMLQCEQRGVEPQHFLPYGKKDKSTGWLRHHRQVRKGENAFLVWAPVKRRPTDEEIAAMEAAGRKVRRDPDGRPSVRIMGFRLSSTFELSQTDPAQGYEHLEFVVPTTEVKRKTKADGGRQTELLTGEDPTGVYDEIGTLIEAEGYSYGFGTPGTTRHLRATSNGVSVGGEVRKVIISDRLEPAQRIKTAIHELAHIRCDHQSGVRVGEDLHRGRRETEAESVAHIVCLALGLDSSRYSDAYVLSWAKGDLDLIKEAMETVTRVAKSILSDLTPVDAAMEISEEITAEEAAA